MTNIKPIQIADLEPGSYYIPVFATLDNDAEFNTEFNTNSPVYKYLGDGEFATEYGEPIGEFYDPELGLYVATNATDGFVQ